MMKHALRLLWLGWTTLLLSPLMLSCTKLGEKGSITLSIDTSSFKESRSAEEVPLLSDFHLEVISSKGKTVYSGKYGEAPEKIMVSPGSYNLSIRSKEFRKPVFSTPQYGDDQLVVVPSGENVNVILKCVMVNAGIRLRMGPDFLEAYPDALVFIESAGGRLQYSYQERRVAYFPAGKVVVYIDVNGKRKDLFTRELEKREILDIKLVAPKHSASGEEISVELDTSKFWIDERFTIGNGGSGGGTDSGTEVKDAMSVGMARTQCGKENVWVYGYIVGVMSGSNLLIEEPFSISSNIVIASNRFIDEREACLAVELRKKDLREALNLEDHPEMLGRKVYIKGNIVDSYFGDAGIKGATDFKI